MNLFIMSDYRQEYVIQLRKHAYNKFLVKFAERAATRQKQTCVNS